MQGKLRFTKERGSFENVAQNPNYDVIQSKQRSGASNVLRYIRVHSYSLMLVVPNSLRPKLRNDLNHTSSTDFAKK